LLIFMKEKFPGVFLYENQLLTLNLTPGFRVYGEKLVKEESKEYRFWDLYRSKLAAAIKNGLKYLPIKPGSTVLYLGASTGTTASHVSDIIGQNGLVYCVEFAQRPMRELLSLCEKRENMLPIMGDARKPEEYQDQIESKVDVIYQDVSQPNQAEIFLLNSRLFLKEKGYGLIAIKSQSIDVTASPSEVFKEFINQVSDEVEIKEKIDLRPYDLEHLFISGIKK
jgi:fibrillarin-like pre-rRNA processing protein